MNAYISLVLAILKQFGRAEVEWITREHNAHADALASLASVTKSVGECTIVFDAIDISSIEPEDSWVLSIILGPSQMDPVIAYLKNEVLPSNKKEAHKIRCKEANYYLGTHDVLYRRTFIGPDMRVVHEDQVEAVLEELHLGSCGALGRMIHGTTGAHTRLLVVQDGQAVRKVCQEVCSVSEACLQHSQANLLFQDVQQSLAVRSVGF